jgi:hypothetical protein
VPEPKIAKNRQHFDLRAPGDLDTECDRLLRLGVLGRDVRDGLGLVNEENLPA